MIIGSVDKTAETQAEKGIDNPFAKWYVLSAYMTDGSGNDHGEYKPQKPTVWAHMLGKWAFSYFTGRSEDAVEREKSSGQDFILS